MASHPSYRTFDSYDHVDSDAGEITFPRSIEANQCPVCLGRFAELQHQMTGGTLVLSICASCGWWHLHRDVQAMIEQDGQKFTITARWWELHHAALTRIDLLDQSLSIEDLRVHLARYWDQRTELTAQQAEDIVAGVLRDHYGGEVVRLTANANTPDGGIDLILLTHDGRIRRAVQVKRRLRREVEGVHEVRNFVGAMMLEGEDTGTFVTTASRFSRAAQRVPNNRNLARSRMTLDLIDGERLLEILEHTSVSRIPDLPSVMNADQVWNAPDGTLIGTRELLFGDIRSNRAVDSIQIMTIRRSGGRPMNRKGFPAFDQLSTRFDDS